MSSMQLSSHQLKAMDEARKMTEAAMKKLVEMEDGHIFQKLYGKCDYCGEIVPIKDLMLEIDFPTIEMEEHPNNYIARVKKMPPRLKCRDHNK